MQHSIKSRTVVHDHPRALLLQGPVGPFFGDMSSGLKARGFDVRRVLFNAGDALFAKKGDTVRFSGAQEEWESWLRSELKESRPDVIILFGSMRPAHKVARKLAEEHSILIICLEEGYLRAGFIACEFGGNNQHSPLCHWTPEQKIASRPAKPLVMRSSFVTMCVWGILYYLTRDAFSKRSDEQLFHRTRESLIPLSASWTIHMSRRIVARATERGNIARLKGKLRKKYILVPLQVPTDSQVRTAARGWDADKLVDASLTALKNGPEDLHLAIKLHPLDRSGQDCRRRIFAKAASMGVLDRVMVFRSGNLGEMTENSSGMVVINSTSAFSAMHHKLPLLVLGDAIFRQPAIVTVGSTTKDVEQFFEERSVRDVSHIAAFFQAVRATALLPGDFYKKEGRKAAVSWVTAKAISAMTETDLAEAAE